MTILPEGYSFSSIFVPFFVSHLFPCWPFIFQWFTKPWVTSPNLCPCGLHGRSSQQCRWTPATNRRQKAKMTTLKPSKNHPPACHSWPSSPCCCFLRQKKHTQQLLTKDLNSDRARSWLCMWNKSNVHCETRLKTMRHQWGEAAANIGQPTTSHTASSWQWDFIRHLCPSRSSCACCGRRTSLSQDRRALNLGNIFWEHVWNLWTPWLIWNHGRHGTRITRSCLKQRSMQWRKLMPHFPLRALSSPSDSYIVLKSGTSFTSTK